MMLGRWRGSLEHLCILGPRGKGRQRDEGVAICVCRHFMMQGVGVSLEHLCILLGRARAEWRLGQGGGDGHLLLQDVPW